MGVVGADAPEQVNRTGARVWHLFREYVCRARDSFRGNFALRQPAALSKALRGRREV
jgi:hypothetical protein